MISKIHSLPKIDRPVEAVWRRHGKFLAIVMAVIAFAFAALLGRTLNSPDYWPMVIVALTAMFFSGLILGVLIGSSRKTHLE